MAMMHHRAVTPPGSGKLTSVSVAHQLLGSKSPYYAAIKKGSLGLGSHKPSKDQFRNIIVTIDPAATELNIQLSGFGIVADRRNGSGVHFTPRHTRSALLVTHKVFPLVQLDGLWST